MVELLDVPYLLEPRMMLCDWVVGVMEREWTTKLMWWIDWSRRMERRRLWSIMMTNLEVRQRHKFLPE